MFNPVHLKTLCSVLTHGSLSGAARELGYTTSAVSQQVAALERALGVTLFERRPHSLVPTAAATEMGRHADGILRKMDQVEQDMLAFAGGERGRLRIATFASAGAHLVPPVLAHFTRRLPQVDLDLQVMEGARDELAELVESGGVDLALDCRYRLVSKEWSEGLRVTPLLTEEMVVLTSAGHATNEREQIELAELGAERWVSNQQGTRDAANLAVACEKAGFEPDVRFRTDDYDVVRGIIRTGVAVALVPPLALGNDPTIRLLRLTDDAPVRDVVAISRADDSNPMLESAFEAFAEAAQVFVGWSNVAFADALTSPLVYAR